jgi:signal transduction histidine kinase/CheY-like chemotaxis protein
MSTKDNDYIWILSRGNVTKRAPSGKPLRIMGTHIDLTERKEAEAEREELEERLRQAQKMEAIGQLAGGVAHDFNNLLQAINGYTELTMNKLPPDSSALENMQKVADAGERAADLVNQLLAFSRRQIMQPTVLEVNNIVSSLLKMLSRIIGEHIQLDFNRSEDVELHVSADRVMLEQVIMNLCVNARDAMPDGGSLTIQTERSVLSPDFCQHHTWAEPGDYVQLTISDTGTGIDSDTLEHIFEPFFTTKGIGKGTGLGLATVYGIVKQHHGLINVRSQPGEGTTFEIYLPSSDNQPNQTDGSEEEEVEGGHETILLAEDENVVNDLAVELLQNAGYTVFSASNGTEALDIFQQHSDEIQLLVLDIIMPDKGGKEVYETIHAQRPDIPVVFASGYSENNLDPNLLRKDGVTLIQKPFKRKKLLKAIRPLLSSSSRKENESE